MPETMRSEVAASWHRSAAAGVEVAADRSPITIAPDDLGEVRTAHALASVYPVIEEVLGGAARACDALLALSDEEGQLLWVSGSTATLARAEAIGFVEGSSWDERVAGTNAPGTALVLDRPVMVVGEEHYREVVRPWSCVASPIHDPATGRVLGVLDVTGGPAVTSPQTMAMVRAAARLAEAELARARPLGAGLGIGGAEALVRAAFTVQCLGRREALLSTVGRSQLLTPRHSEVLALLVSAPRGLAGDELAVLLYADEDAAASTLRAEMNRLRGMLGGELVGSRPYRLLLDVAADWHLVRACLASGDVVAALRHYAGPLLPASEAPGVVALREEVHHELRAAVLDSRRPELMAAWTRAPWGADDRQAWLAQQDLLPSRSPLRPLVRSQLARLDREHGLPAPSRGVGAP